RKRVESNMKSLLSAFSCLVLVVTLHAAEIKFGDDITVRKSDLRLVGTTTVDLGPVHAWLQKNQGERPLKHWKRLQVFNIKGTVSTMAQCVVKTEDGKFDEILVKNLPAQVPEFMAAFAILSLDDALSHGADGALDVEDL